MRTLADVFKSDAFSMTSMTAAINTSEVPPNLLASLKLFEEEGVETTSIAIEKQGASLIIIPAKARGAQGTPMRDAKRKAISFEIPHFPVIDHLTPEMVQNVRQFGTTDQLTSVTAKRDQKLQAMSNSVENTIEYHRLGAFQGVVLDADGETVLYDLYDEFDIDPAANVNFDLDAAWAPTDGGVIRGKIYDMKESMRASLGNAPVVGGVLGLCGSNFFRKISNHPEIRETYTQQQAANALRDSDARDQFSYGGCTFVSYPGYGEVEIDPNHCAFGPLGIPGLFITRYAPAPWFSAVNTTGLPKYAMASLDSTGEKSIDLEAQTNDIHICTRVEALRTGVVSA